MEERERERKNRECEWLKAREIRERSWRERRVRCCEACHAAAVMALPLRFPAFDHFRPQRQQISSFNYHLQPRIQLLNLTQDLLAAISFVEHHILRSRERDARQPSEGIPR